MSGSFERRLDGSYSLLNGDLQFKSPPGTSPPSYQPGQNSFSGLSRQAQKKLISEFQEKLNALALEVAENSTYCMLLLDELSQYERNEDLQATYGLSRVTRDEAIRHTQHLVDKARIKIVSLNQQIACIEEQRDEIIAAYEEDHCCDDTALEIGSEAVIAS